MTRRKWPSIHGGETELEDKLLGRIQRWKLPSPETQLQLVPGCKFRFDIGWPAYKVALECQGAIWKNGAHNRGNGVTRDATKSALAQAHGWLVLAITQVHMDKDIDRGLIETALWARGWEKPL